MNVRTRIVTLSGCSIMVMLALAIGALDSPNAAVAAEPPDDEKTLAPDGDSDRGPLAGPKGPRREAPPAKADEDEDQDEDEWEEECGEECEDEYDEDDEEQYEEAEYDKDEQEVEGEEERGEEDDGYEEDRRETRYEAESA